METFVSDLANAHKFEPLMECFSRSKQQTHSHIVSEMHWPQVQAVTDASFLSQIGANFSIAITEHFCNTKLSAITVSGSTGLGS